MGQNGWFVRMCAGLLLIGVSFLGYSCRSVNVNPAPLVRTLEGKGWTYVDFPRELLGAGSIVSISDSQGIRYRGDINDCVPKEAIVKRTGRAGIDGIYNQEFTMSVQAFLGYHSVKIGGDVNKISKVGLMLQDAEEVALSEPKLREWLAANHSRLSEVCLGYLLRKTPLDNDSIEVPIAILVDVLGVKKYSYTFYDRSGGKITLTPAVLKDYFSFSSDGTITSDGKLEFDSKVPLFIAFKSGFFYTFGSTMGASASQGLSPATLQQKRNSVLVGEKP